MASPEYDQGKKSEGGWWRWLAIGIAAIVVLNVIVDTINIEIGKNIAASSG